jgi:hypothetical protein
MPDITPKELITAKDLAIADAIADLERVSTTMQRLAQSDDQHLKMVFGPGTQRTIIELGAVKGRLETVLKLLKPSDPPQPSPPAKK